jgi:hypothetical protein
MQRQSESDALEHIPPALRPPGVRLPDAVGDVLMGMEAMHAVAEPSERQQLLRRVDSKYALPRAQLPNLLRSLSGDYDVLTAAGQYAASYATIYFDTEERRCLTDHLRGRRPRHKVRVRHYLDRELSVLEVKTKTPGSRTEKLQRSRPFGGNGLSAEEHEWAGQCTGIRQPMLARAWSACQRITLLRADAAGRMTIDLNVTLGTQSGARSLEGTALLEIKQESGRLDRQLMQTLREAQARPVGLSKYVAAMMHATPVLPHARFLAVLGRYARAEYWKECRT